MKTYNFEFSDTALSIKLMLLCCFIFFLLIAATIIERDIIGLGLGFILAFLIPFLIFWFYRKKIKKTGSASIYDSYTEFNLSDSTQKIAYNEIKSYKIERYNGTMLKIIFINGAKFKLFANSNFCSSIQFTLFCFEFESTIQEYIRNNNITIIRQKSMFESKWIFPLLIILTAGIIVGSIIAVIKGKQIPGSFFSSLFLLIPLWAGYINAKNKKI